MSKFHDRFLSTLTKDQVFNNNSFEKDESLLLTANTGEEENNTMNPTDNGVNNCNKKNKNVNNDKNDIENDNSVDEWLNEKIKAIGKPKRLIDLSSQLALIYKDRDDLQLREVKDNTENIKPSSLEWNETQDAALVAMALYHGSLRHNLRETKVFIILLYY